MFRNIKGIPLFAVIGIFVLTLSLVAACGEASTPSAATPTPGGQQATPTATPTATATLPPTTEPVIEVAKLTYLGPDAGNEVWNPRDAEGEIYLWQQMHLSKIIGGNAEGTFDATTGIASKWEVTDDGKGWVFTIKDGIKFHDGSVIDAGDVAFSLGLAFSEESASESALRMIPFIDQPARVIGNTNTVRIDFTQPIAFFVSNISEMEWATTTGAVISEDYWNSVGGARGFEDAPAPGTSGPFSLVNHNVDEDITYERFDDHFLFEERFHAYKSFKYGIVPELAIRVAALQAGDVDIISAQLSVVDQVESAGGKVIFAPESSFLWLEIVRCHPELDDDNLPTWCNDKRVRLAIDHAIDRSQLQQLYGGAEFFKLNGSPTASPSTIGFRDTLVPVAFDPVKANELMAEAGFPNGAGFNSGRTLVLNTWEQGLLTVESATLVCESWVNVLNIDCRVNVGEQTTLKEQRKDQVGFMQIRTNESAFDPGRKMFARYTEGARSYLPAADQVIRDAIAKATLTEMDVAFAVAHQIVFDEHPDMLLGSIDTPYGLGPRVEDWQPWPIVGGAMWTVKMK